MKHRGDDDKNNGPKEAKLDDIIYNYGGVEAIHVSGPNTPNHVMKAYRELCELRHKRGDFLTVIRYALVSKLTMKQKIA